MKLRALSNLSAYARPEAHLTKQTIHGAIITVLGVLLAITLFVHELHYFYKLHRVTKMAVDLERRHDLLIQVDMFFPAIPCAVLSMDVLDIAGTQESDATLSRNINIHKRRIDSEGRQVGKTEYYTPQSQHMVDAMGDSMMTVDVPQAMQHLVEMEDEADHHEGCHMDGSITTKRLAGRLHISVHQNMVFQLLPQLLGGHHMPKVMNISHTIKNFSFGPRFDGQVNPLDGYERIVMGPDFLSYKYFLKVVPTHYYGRLGGVTETQQYSVTEYATKLTNEQFQPPAIDFMYDLSPIVVSINDTPPSVLHFLVRLAAVVGGVFAVTRMTDRWVHWFVTLVSGAA